jgi:hypothetical protein
VTSKDDNVEEQRPEDIIEATDDQLAVWREICDLARQIRANRTEEYNDSDDNDNDGVLKEHLLELWMLLICHTTGARRYQSPLLSFCAMLSIKPSTRSWMEPGNFNSSLSAIIWVIQLLVFAVDAYTATVVTAPPGGIEHCAGNQSDPLYPSCVITSVLNDNNWNIGYHSQAGPYTTPTYLRNSLNWIWNTYKKPVIVSEFGFPINGETSLSLTDARFDSPRSQYYLSYIQAILQAIWEDNVHVLGALAWSFVDNWEFGGFSTAYGLQVVNRTSQERDYKKSFFDLMDYYNSRK